MPVAVPAPDCGKRAHTRWWAGPATPTTGPTSAPVSPTGPPTYEPSHRPRPPLPVTGAAVWPLVGVGAVVTGGGIGLLLLARQRRREES